MYMYENRCIPTIKPQKIELVGNDVEIFLPNLTLLNGKKWYLLICECIPKGTDIGDVIFIVNDVKYPAVNGLANILKTDMIRCRRRYTIVYGWDTPHFVVCGTQESAFVPETAPTKKAKKKGDE